jgi:hypothetical protein
VGSAAQAAWNGLLYAAAAERLTASAVPIDAQQKQVFDLIDGERTIGEITRRHGNPDARVPAVRPALAVRPGRVRCFENQ